MDKTPQLEACGSHEGPNDSMALDDLFMRGRSNLLFFSPAAACTYERLGGSINKTRGLSQMGDSE
jgi:hypothetical protein